MGLNVLIVPDKFKGTLTAQSAAEAVSRGWQRARPMDRLELLPMSDGGDGFGDVMSRLLGANPQNQKTCDAAHRSCTARWWWQPKSRTAVIDTASVVGLAMLPPRQYHPFELDTYGLGKVLQSAFQKGARRLLVGLGGSATNDGGFGLARALGWEFLNANGEVIELWTELSTANTVRAAKGLGGSLEEVVVAVDVQNPLLGARGATRVYGPQKGLKPADFPLAELCLRNLASLVQQARQDDLAHKPGAGAAGGLGFGFMAFVGGRLEPGFELFAQEAGLEHRLKEADLVITGEGAIDSSSFMGKGAGQIARWCKDLGIPCIGMAGAIGPDVFRKRWFVQSQALTDLTGMHQAKTEAAWWLEKLANKVAGTWVSGTGNRRRKVIRPTARSRRVG
jgi:glycerate kinase